MDASLTPIYSPMPSLIHKVYRALLVDAGDAERKKTQSLAQDASLWEGIERSGEKMTSQGNKCCDGGPHGPKQNNRVTDSEPKKSSLLLLPPYI